MSSPKKKSSREARLEKIEKILETHENCMEKNLFFSLKLTQPCSFPLSINFFL